METKWFTQQQYRKIYRFLGKQIVLLICLGSLVGLSVAGIELLFAFGMQAFVSSLSLGAPLGSRLPTFIPKDFYGLLVYLLGVGILRSLLQWAQYFVSGSTQDRMVYLQRSRLARWVFFAPAINTAKITFLYNERAHHAAVVVTSLQGTIAAAVTTTFLFTQLMILSAPLTFGILVILFFALLGFRFLDFRLKLAGLIINNATEQANSKLVVSIKNILLLRIYGTTSDEHAAIEDNLKKALSANLTSHRVSATKYVLPQGLGVGLVCLTAVYSRSQNGLDSTILIPYIYLLFRLLQNISEMTRTRSLFVTYFPQLIESAQWWAEHSHDGVRNPQKNIDSAEPIRFFSGPIGWDVSHLTFSYPGSSDPILSNFTLKIAPGNACVILGASGSGKSTLLDLLLGNLAPQKGNIDIIIDKEGQSGPLAALKNSILRQIGYVGPESFLIDGTILENLLYGLNTKPSDSEINDALLATECHFALEMGLNHRITEQGVGLSAGQKQRLSLARAILRKPKAIILDESTANLDVETETRLVDGLIKLKRKVTIIAVTHRQGLLRLADQVVELK